MKPKITDVFNKFAGREVAVIETPYKQHLKHAGITVEGISTEFAPNEPTIAEMEKAAKDNGFTLRLWLPDGAGTCDYRTDRINAHVEKGADGKYRVSKNFDIG
jgi:hypothetical protein